MGSSVVNLSIYVFVLLTLLGKKGFINNVTGRMGLPEKTLVKNQVGAQSGFVVLSTHDAKSLDDLSRGILFNNDSNAALISNQVSAAPSAGGSGRLAPKYRVEMASYALPHPYKDTSGEADHRKYNLIVCFYSLVQN